MSREIDRLPRQRSPHLLAIDTSYFVHRAFHACVHAGKPGGAAPAVLGTLARFLLGRQPTHVLFAGEGMGSFRRDLCPTYKAGRERPAGLDACEAAVDVALQSGGLSVIRAGGHEGDDVLFTAADAASAAGIPVVIVARDKDVEQCISDDREVLAWDGEERVLDEAAVERRWGVRPGRLADLFALCGDSTDGVPGVPGWGKTRALEVLRDSGWRRLDLLIQPGGEWYVPAKFRKKLVAHRAAIAMCLELVRLRLVRVPALSDLGIDPIHAGTALREAAERLRR